MLNSGFFKAINEEVCDYCEHTIGQGEALFALKCQTIYERSDILICEKCAFKLREDILEQRMVLV